MAKPPVRRHIVNTIGDLVVGETAILRQVRQFPADLEARITSG
jgi:hypothetical protein